MSDHFPQLELDAQLCFPLYAAARAVTRRYTSLLEGVGLTYPQYLVMLALWGSGEPLSVGELGRRLHLDSGTLTPLLKRLEGAQIVVRRRDPEDERRVMVQATAKGHRLRAKVADVPGALSEQLGLTGPEAIQLQALLGTVLTRMG